MKSPFVPYFIGWIVAVLAAFIALRLYVPVANVWRVLIALNGVTFLLYGLDKVIAGMRVPRVPERLLHLTAFLGAPIGALAAMQTFRHKTRKQSFQLVLALAVLLEVSLVTLYLRYR